jgi:hypothetical protein
MAAAAAGVPCVTTLPGVFAAVRGIEALRGGSTDPRSLQEYHGTSWGVPRQGRLRFEDVATSGVPRDGTLA